MTVEIDARYLKDLREVFGKPLVIDEEEPTVWDEAYWKLQMELAEYLRGQPQGHVTCIEILPMTREGQVCQATVVLLEPAFNLLAYHVPGGDWELGLVSEFAALVLDLREELSCEEGDIFGGETDPQKRFAIAMEASCKKH